MNEMEVKVLYINPDEIESKLKEIGAKLVKDEEQTNIRFDFEDSYLKRQLHGYLRIRVTNDNINGCVTNTLTLKKNLSRNEFRVNEEIETEITNVDETIRILENLKLIKKKPGLKKRRSYKYEDILFEIDEWDKSIYAYPYLEIEVQNKDRLEVAIQLLNLDRNNITAKSIEDLIKDN